MDNLTTKWVCNCKANLPLTFEVCPNCKRRMPESVRNKIFQEVLNEEKQYQRAATIKKHSAIWFSLADVLEDFRHPVTVFVWISIVVLMLVVLILRNLSSPLAIFTDIGDLFTDVFESFKKLWYVLGSLYSNISEAVTDNEIMQYKPDPLMNKLSFIRLFFEQLSYKISVVTNFIKDLFN